MVARLMHGSTGVPKMAIVPRALLRSKSTKLKLPTWQAMADITNFGRVSVPGARMLLDDCGKHCVRGVKRPFTHVDLAKRALPEWALEATCGFSSAST